MQLDATVDDVTATANQIYYISAWQSQWRHRLWRRELHMNLSRVSAALCGPCCLVPRPHYSARSKRFGPCGPSEVNWPRRTGKRRTGTKQRSTYIHVHFSRYVGNFEKIIISLLGWLASRGIIEVKVTDNDKKNSTKFTWYLNFHQNLRPIHHLTSVGKSPELSWQGCCPLRCLGCYCSLISETDSRSASFIRLSIKGSVFSSSSTVNGFSCWPLQHNFGCCFLWMTSLSGPFI